jgi:hypothetical protein
MSSFWHGQERECVCNFSQSQCAPTFQSICLMIIRYCAVVSAMGKMGALRRKERGAAALDQPPSPSRAPPASTLTFDLDLRPRPRSICTPNANKALDATEVANEPPATTSGYATRRKDAMNLPRPFLNRSNPLRPAIHFFTNTFNQSARPASKSIDSLDGDDLRFSVDSERPTPSRYAAHSRNSSGGAESSASGIPLIDFSRTPSPSPYNARARSATQSEDEDESIPLSLRPLVAESGVGGRWARAWRDGGVGAFLFGSWSGWQIYVVLITIWYVAAGLALVGLNRVLLWCK